MSRYTVELLETEDDNFFFGVYEQATEQIITHYLFLDEAEAYKDFLEGGGGFHGRTPSFMLTDVLSDVNDKFDLLMKE